MQTITYFSRFKDPTDTTGTMRRRVAEVFTSEPENRRRPHRAGAARIIRISEPLVTSETVDRTAIITARVGNVGEAYAEIEAHLNEAERDPDVERVAIFTLSGIFAILPLR